MTFDKFGKGQTDGERFAKNLAGQVTPIFSAKPTARYSSGARTILRINNELIGFAFRISWRINTMQEEILTIDDYTPYELAPQRITVEGTIGALHIPGQGATASYIQSNLLSFMTHRYISIEVRDVTTNDLLFYTSKAAIVSRSEDINADDLSKVTLNFKAIGWYDEKKPEPQKTAQDKKDSDNKKNIDNNGTIFDKIKGTFGF